MNKKIIHTLLKIIVTLFLLLLLVMKVDLKLLFLNLKNISLVTLLLSISMFIISIILLSFKWSTLLPKQKIFILTKFNFIGLYYSILLPGQITGEAVKAYKLGKGKLEAEEIAASVLVDKITGILGLVILSLVGVIFTNYRVPAIITVLLVVLIILLLSILFLFRVKFISNTFIKFLNYSGDRWARFKIITNKLVLFITSYNNYSKQTFSLFINIFIGVCFQVLCIIINIVLSNAIGFNISFFDWCWIFGTISVILLLPITIGGLGLREGSAVGLLALFGVKNDMALALSLSIFGLQIVGAIIGAVFEYFFKEKEKFTEIK